MRFPSGAQNSALWGLTPETAAFDMKICRGPARQGNGIQDLGTIRIHRPENQAFPVGRNTQAADVRWGVLPIDLEVSLVDRSMLMMRLRFLANSK